jgi:hypothetical protein
MLMGRESAHAASLLSARERQGGPTMRNACDSLFFLSTFDPSCRSSR